MAKKPQTIKPEKVDLTKAERRQVEKMAEANCRTVRQELTFMIRRQLNRVEIPVRALAALERYDDAPPVAPAEEPALYKPPVPAAPGVDVAWTPEQEQAVAEAAQSVKMAEPQLMALRLIHKDPEAVLDAIRAESVPA